MQANPAAAQAAPAAAGEAPGQPSLKECEGPDDTNCGYAREKDFGNGQNGVEAGLRGRVNDNLRGNIHSGAQAGPNGAGAEALIEGTAGPAEGSLFAKAGAGPGGVGADAGGRGCVGTLCGEFGAGPQGFKLGASGIPVIGSVGLPDLGSLFGKKRR